MILMAVRNVFRNKKRSIIIMIALIFATALVSFTRLLTFGMHQETIWNAVNLSSGYIQVSANGYLENESLDRILDVKEDLIKSLKVNGIKTIAPRIKSFGLISKGQNTRFASIRGIEPIKEKDITILHKKIIKGTYLNNDKIPKDSMGRKLHQAILGENIANNLSAVPGDIISIVTTQFDGSVGAILVKVKGLYKSGDNILDSSSIYINLNSARVLFGTYDSDEEFERYTSLVLGVDSVKTADKVFKKLSEKYPLPKLDSEKHFSILYDLLKDKPLLKSSTRNFLIGFYKTLSATLPIEMIDIKIDRGQSENYDPVINLWPQLIPGVLQLMELDQISGEISLFFIIFIMAFGVLNIVQMSIHERRKEFGVLLALGTSSWRLYFTFLFEIIILIIPSILIGTSIGAAVSYYLELNPVQLTGSSAQMFIESGFAPVVKAIVDAKEIFIAILSIVLPAFLFTTIAARRIIKLNPIKVIRER